MSPGTADTLLLAGGGLLASEATGLTDFTSVGRDGGQGPQRPRLPTPGTPPTQLPPGLNLGQLFSNFATPADVAAAFQAGANAGGQGVGSDALIRAFNAGATTVRETTNQGGQRVPTVTEIVDLIDERTPDVPGPGPGPGPGPTSGDGSGGSSPDEFKLQDLEGTGPLNIGTAFAAAGESGVGVGETVGAVGDAVGSPGRPAPGEEDSLFGRIYQAGATTGAAYNTVSDAYDAANRDYREATAGARGAVKTAKDVTRPWRWDVDVGGLSPIGTASAGDAGDSGTSSRETSGGRDSSYTPSSREVPTQPARSGLTAGSSSSSTSPSSREVPTRPARSGPTAGSSTSTSSREEEPEQKRVFSGGFVQ